MKGYKDKKELAFIKEDGKQYTVAAVAVDPSGIAGPLVKIPINDSCQCHLTEIRHRQKWDVFAWRHPTFVYCRPGLFEKSGAKLGNHILCH